MLDSFLNGFITFKRGKQEPKPGQPDTPAAAVKKNGNINNIVLKKGENSTGINKRRHA